VLAGSIQPAIFILWFLIFRVFSAMNAKLTTLFLSSVVCTGLISGLLVEPSNKLTGNLIQPAQAQACNGPTKSGRGTNRAHASNNLANAIALAGLIGCGTITYTQPTPQDPLWTASQETRTRTWAEWGGTLVPNWVPDWPWSY